MRVNCGQVLPVVALARSLASPVTAGGEDSKEDHEVVLGILLADTVVRAPAKRQEILLELTFVLRTL